MRRVPRSDVSSGSCELVGCRLADSARCIRAQAAPPPLARTGSARRTHGEPATDGRELSDRGANSESDRRSSRVAERSRWVSPRAPDLSEPPQQLIELTGG